LADGAETIDGKLSFLSLSLYPTGVLLILVPTVEFALSIWPAELGNLVWRVGAVGTLSQTLLLPTLGVIALAAAASLGTHPRLLRVVAVCAAAFAILLLITLAGFALDVLNFRELIAEEQAVGILPAALNTILSQGLSALALLAVAWASLVTSRGKKRRDTDTGGIVVDFRGSKSN